MSKITEGNTSDDSSVEEIPIINNSDSSSILPIQNKISSTSSELRSSNKNQSLTTTSNNASSSSNQNQTARKTVNYNIGSNNSGKTNGIDSNNSQQNQKSNNMNEYSSDLTSFSNQKTSNQIDSDIDKYSTDHDIPRISTLNGNVEKNNLEQFWDSAASRIGIMYQVDMNEFLMKEPDTFSQLKEKEICVWKPPSMMPINSGQYYPSDQEIEKYLEEAINKYSYNLEQALGLLYFNKHNIPKSLSDMLLFVPKPNEWTNEDKIVFEQAYMFHGKNFNKIKQVLPDKSQANLVSFYYMWKKTRTHVSLIDQHQSISKNGLNLESNLNSELNGEINGLSGNKKKNNGFPSEINNSDNEESVEADFSQRNTNSNANDLVNFDDELDEDDDNGDENFNSNVNKICCNCDVITQDLMSTPKGMLCSPCYTYYKNTGGLMRPELNKQNNNTSNYFHNKTNRYLNNLNGNGNSELSGPPCSNLSSAITFAKNNFHKTLRKPPKGIYLNYEELLNLAQSETNETFDVLNRRLNSLKKEVQANKQDIAQILTKLTYENEFKMAINDVLAQINKEKLQDPCWNSNEIAYAIQGFNKYGENFKAISEVIGSKSENSVKSFYNYYKDNFSLDKLIVNNASDLKSKSVSILNEMKKIQKSDLPTVSLIPISANNAIKNELDIKIENTMKDIMSSNIDHHVDNISSYHPLKDTDDVIFISNESN